MAFELLNTHLIRRGLQKPNLEVLKQDASLYKTLLLQPVESIEYSNDFIRITDRVRANSKFRKFFQKAVKERVELAITPEYSCPWGIIEELIRGSGDLKENQIWIIGCESIKAQELMDLVIRNAHIEWIYENEIVEANFTNDHFFDPVCYIFKTRSFENKIKTVVTIQFKTHHFGGAGMEWERDNYIQGKDVYIIENREASTRLVTFICSDTLNVASNCNVTSLPEFINYPYLIVHIQLNQAPNHIDYCEYRRETYKMGWGNKEFICLNWGRNILIDDKIWNDYGGSALYFQTNADEEKKFNTNDERINKNHKSGLYYTRWSDRKAHMYFLNYDEHIFLLRNTKASQAAALPATRNRSGPEMIRIYSWNNKNSDWESIENANDGFNAVCDEISDIGSYDTLKKINSTNSVDVERLVCLSVGRAWDKDWYLPTKNEFFLIKDDEINKRITFTQNPNENVRQTRKDFLHQYGILEYRIIINPSYFPDSLNDLKNNCVIKYKEDNYKKNYNLNLFPRSDSGVPACGAFIGLKTSKDAKVVLSKMIELFKENQFGKRTVVWYFNNAGQILNESISEKAKITNNTGVSDRSIKSTKMK